MPLVPPKVAIIGLNAQPMPHGLKAVTIGLNAQAMAIDQPHPNALHTANELNALTTIENLPLSVALLPTTEANAQLMLHVQKADTTGLNALVTTTIDLPPLNALHTPHAQIVQPMPLELKADTTGLNVLATTTIDLPPLNALRTLLELKVGITGLNALVMAKDPHRADTINRKVGLLRIHLTNLPTNQEPKAGVPRLTVERNLPLGTNAVVHLEIVLLQKIVKETAKAVRLWQT
jgi:hypothetical protein